MANRFLNNIKINDSYTLPDADGTEDQIIKTDGAGELTFIDQGDVIAGEADKAKSVILRVKNSTASPMTKGQVICEAVSASPPNGNLIEVALADNNGTNTMPALGILNEDLDAAGGANDEGDAIMFGKVSGIDTSAFDVGDEVFVSDTPGGLTITKPTGVKYIQKVGVVIRDDNTNGTIEVFGAGRVNDVPTPLYIDHANQRLGVGITSPQTTLHMGVQNANPVGTEEFRLESRSGYGYGGNSVVNLYTGTYGSSGVYFGDNATYSSQPGRIEFIDVGNSLNYDSTQYHYWKIGGSTKMTLKDSFFGIGTTNPTVKLHAGSTSTSGTTTEEFRLQSGTSSGNGGEAVVNLVSGTFGTSGIYFGNQSTYTSQDAYLKYADASNATTLNFSSSLNLESGSSGSRMYINSLGSVGINTTNPNQRLTINGTDQYVATEHSSYLWGSTTTIGVKMGTDATAGLLDFRRWIGSGTTHGTALITQVNSDGGWGLDFRVDTQSTNTAATTSRMFLSTSGEVGIGTTGPQAKLHVSSGTANEDCVVIIESDTDNNDEASNPRLELRQDGGAVIGRLGYRNNTNSLELINQYAEALYLGASNSTDLTILSNGNVGIGDTDPDAKLTVFRTDSTYAVNLSDTESRAGLSVKSSSDFDSKLTISSGASSRQYIQAVNNTATTGRDIAINPYGGNVGIGTDSPAQKLHVAGNARITGALYDSNNSPGTSNQILSSTASGTDWISIENLGTFLNIIDVSEPGNTTAEWSLIKTLPVSTSSQRDTLFIKIVGGGWNDNLRYEAEITLSNRDGFNYFWDVKGGSEYSTGGNGSNRLRVVAYSQTDGTVDVYLYKTSYMTGWIYATFQNTGAPEIITSLGSPTTTQPSGTEVFTTYGNTYPANIAAVNNSVGIGTHYPSNKLDVNGNIEASRIILPTTGTAGGGTVTTPAGKLDIRSDSTWSNSAIIARTTTNQNPVLAFYRPSGSAALSYPWWLEANGSTFQIKTGVTANIGSETVSTKVTINSSGNVGIGTTNPQTGLQLSSGVDNRTVGGTDTGIIRLTNTYGSAFGAGGEIQFGLQDVGGRDVLSLIKGSYTGYSSGNYGGDLEFHTRKADGLGLQQRMTITNAGDVGIGTTLPAAKLEVEGGNHLLQLSTISSTGNPYMSFNQAGARRSFIQHADSGDTLQIVSEYGGIDFYTGTSGTETKKMTILSGGNVGIETDNPTAKLDINDTADEVDLTSTTNFAINTGGAINAKHYKHVNLESPEMEWSVGGSTDLNWKKLATIVIGDANYSGFGAEVEITDFSGNYGSATAEYGDVYRGGLSIYHQGGSGDTPKKGIITIHNDMIPHIRIYKIAGSGNSSYEIQVKSPSNFRQMYVKLKAGIGNQLLDIFSHANNTNGSTSGGTAYTPDAYTSGNQFKTGFTTVTANRGNILYRLGVVNTSPSYPLDVTGTIRATGDVIAYSDIRVKENIKTIDNAVNKVKALRGVEYNKIDSTEQSIGVIAQEIEEVIPQVVKEDNQGMKSVAYGNITAVLIEAIKEQQNQIDELKNQLDAFTK